MQTETDTAPEADATPKPKIEVWYSGLHEGLGHRPTGTKPLNMVNGTERDWWPKKPLEDVTIGEMQSVARKGMSGDVAGVMLDFERASAQQGSWTYEQWRLWSYNLVAAFELEGYTPEQYGFLYDMSPEGVWNSRQWAGTARMRIPRTASQSFYTHATWMKKRYDILLKSRLQGLDIIVTIGFVDQNVSPAKWCTEREFEGQVQLASQLWWSIPATDNMPKFYLNWWNWPIGHKMHAPAEMLDKGVSIIEKYFEIIPWLGVSPVDPPAGPSIDGDDAGASTS